MKTTNCVYIGKYAGIDIVEGDGIVIIGDDIRNLDPDQNDVIFIGDKIAIGKTVFGKHNTLYDIICEHQLNKINN
jgi:hypothetical protein